MAKVTYEVIAMADAKERDLPYSSWGWETAREDCDYEQGIWRCEDGVPVEFVGEDGGEPEDQTLGRDWSWVAPALQAAYDRGKEAAT